MKFFYKPDAVPVTNQLCQHTEGNSYYWCLASTLLGSAVRSHMACDSTQQWGWLQKSAILRHLGLLTFTFYVLHHSLDSWWSGCHYAGCSVLWHCISKINDDSTCYNFNIYQQTLIIFGRNVADSQEMSVSFCCETQHSITSYVHQSETDSHAGNADADTCQVGRWNVEVGDGGGEVHHSRATTPGQWLCHGLQVVKIVGQRRELYQ